ncbi:hypothetical protein B0H10DRAFT_1948721 [Mycena sp. CBHHK59/15]|nr:hypothetical protein B0H10DRAFT_1948721 [Mycena sp. CBHHK59/15]
MRAAADLSLRQFKDRVYSVERHNASHGFTPISAYFSNPTITAVLDHLLQISSLEILATTIPRWKFHSNHGASLLALIRDLQRDFGLQFEAAQLERNEKNRLRTKSKCSADVLEDSDDEGGQSEDEQMEPEDEIENTPSVPDQRTVPQQPEAAAAGASRRQGYG